MQSQSDNPTSIVRRTLRGGVALGSRQVLVQGINVVGGILLARLLSPVEFGLYAIITFVLGFLTTFGDAGLAASLIRQREEPSDADYRAIFSFQLLLVLATVILAWTLASPLTAVCQLPPGNVRIFRLLALAFLCTSLQVVPQVHLERHLQFGRMAAIEVAQALTFNLTAVGLAWGGYGVDSFAFAVLGRSAVGALLANLVSPWRIAWLWNWTVVRRHLAFGLPYQGTQVLGVINSAVNPVVMVAVFGLADAGYIAWAGALVGYLQQPLFLLNRLLFPTYSRLEDEEMLVRGVNISYAVTGFLFFLLLALLAGTAPLLTEVVYTAKWFPALPLLYGLLMAGLFYPMAIPNGPLALSLGWSGLVFKINIFKSLLFWGGIFLFIGLTQDRMSFVYAQLLTESTHVILYAYLRKRFDAIDVIGCQAPALVAGGGTLLVLFALRVNFAEVFSGMKGLLGLTAAGGVSFLMFYTLLWLFWEKILGNSTFEDLSRAAMSRLAR